MLLKYYQKIKVFADTHSKILFRRQSCPTCRTGRTKRRETDGSADMSVLAVY